MSSLTFFGPDGCGKSTIAAAYERELVSHDHETRLFGGSSYHNWLTPRIAKRFLLPGSTLIKNPKTREDRVKLYEDIAICCYGLGKELSQAGVQVVIDSDPYLKRLVWATVERQGVDDQGIPDYFNEFEQRVTEALGKQAFPDAIAGVDMSNQDSRRNYMGRILKRGVVSDFDPKSTEESFRISIACEFVWQRVVLGDCMARFAGSKILEIPNSDVPADEVVLTHQGIARHIYESIHY